MKLNCGLTEESKLKLKNKAAEALRQRYKDAASPDGEVFIPWWPVRIGDYDCRLFEPVRRVLIGFWYGHRVIQIGCGFDLSEVISEIVDFKKKPAWRYEAINKT